MTTMTIEHDEPSDMRFYVQKIEDLENEMARMECAPQTLADARKCYEEFVADLIDNPAALEAEIGELQALITHLQSWADFSDGGTTASARSPAP